MSLFTNNTRATSSGLVKIQHEKIYVPTAIGSSYPHKTNSQKERLYSCIIASSRLKHTQKKQW